MNGADVLCDTLIAEGVDVCFANPGTSEMHFVAALDREPRMRCILGLFEGVVTGAADGYARMAERPAATLLHTGPGLANGLADLHNARRARTPIVNVVGDHASYHLPFDAPLTTNIESFARPVSHWLRRIAGPQDVGPATEAACRAARGCPGVATPILPADEAWGSVDAEPAIRPARPRSAQRATVAAETIRAAAEAMRGTPPGRCGLLLGPTATRGGALDTAGRIAVATGARLLGEVFVSRVEGGRGRLPIERIPYPVDQATALLEPIDLMVLVDAPPPVAFFAYPGKPSSLLRDGCRVVTLARPGEDTAGALAALLDDLGGGTREPASPRGPTRVVEASAGALTGAGVAAVVARLLPEHCIVIDEALTSARELFATLAHAPRHDYLMNTGGAIGIGIPLAVGAAIACPERKVLALQADGSGMYTVQGLWAQARENLDIVTVILANRAYAILQTEMRNLGVEGSR